jgi:glycosyltransferase involved in cell wall biosynthesis
MRSFHPVYNPLMAIRVLARLRATMPTASLVMAGQDKGLEFETRRLAEALGLNGAVHFPGFLDMAAKVKEGDAADIYINTNHVDNMPVTVVEACAVGLPVVATAVGGVPDLLTDGETGLLVPDDDDQAMTTAIHRLLNDPALATRLSTNGRQLAERSSWEQVRPLWERIFAEVMARANRSGMERL